MPAVTDDAEDTPFQQIYDYLVLADDQWTNPFHGGNQIARNWAGDAIERLVMMAAGQKIEFATGGLATDGFDTTAVATVFTASTLLELDPTTLRGGGAWQPSRVTASPRSTLRQVNLAEVGGPLDKPWRVQLELSYEGRGEPIVIKSGTSVPGRAAPVFGFLPSLLADLGR